MSSCEFDFILTSWLQSVETPSKVDPQWNILYWGSGWILITACLVAVGCEWGTTSVYFGIIYVCFVPRILPVFTVGPKCQHRFFLFMSKISFEGHKQILQNIPCRFKTWMGFVGQILIKLKTSFIRGFLQLSFDALLGVTYANMLVATQRPLKRRGMEYVRKNYAHVPYIAIFYSDVVRYRPAQFDVIKGKHFWCVIQDSKNNCC